MLSQIALPMVEKLTVLGRQPCVSLKTQHRCKNLSPNFASLSPHANPTARSATKRGVKLCHLVLGTTVPSHSKIKQGKRQRLGLSPSNANHRLGKHALWSTALACVLLINLNGRT